MLTIIATAGLFLLVALAGCRLFWSRPRMGSAAARAEARSWLRYLRQNYPGSSGPR